MKHMDEAARAQAAGEGEATKAPAGLDLERLQRELDEDPTLQAILEEVRRGGPAAGGAAGGHRPAGPPGAMRGGSGETALLCGI